VPSLCRTLSIPLPLRASHCHSEHPTATQSSSGEKAKQQCGYSRNGTQPTTGSGPPFNFFCTICKRPGCTDGGGAEAALQGISPRGNKGPGCSGEIRSTGTKTGSGEQEPPAERTKQMKSVWGQKPEELQAAGARPAVLGRRLARRRRLCD